MTRPVQGALALRAVGRALRDRPAPSPDAELDALLGAEAGAAVAPRILAASGRWRVIRCRADLQWIVQEWAGRRRPQWHARAFVYASATLAGVLLRPSLGIPPADAAVLARAAQAMNDQPRGRSQ